MFCHKFILDRNYCGEHSVFTDLFRLFRFKFILEIDLILFVVFYMGKYNYESIAYRITCMRPGGISSKPTGKVNIHVRFDFITYALRQPENSHLLAFKGIALHCEKAFHRMKHNPF